ncbi:lipopolysaccharide assembly protein LapB [Halochromatium salexigens]|uniref:Lipopolysaccharide assembly protein B n=1 Tax=Halochromatium salexigens TaxID=49447 RepID=A0AAJ0XHB8_HALSE|nr:lipopolysaccharide assembly protein LapB [Halochromatium salexigens]
MQWLFLLLPIAAASGWLVARRAVSGRRGESGCGSTDPVFFRGLNYLLNEQPDKALDVFLRLAEVDGETAETHLALGALFRRRGEVDRAIRIHQNLVARETLSSAQRGYALYELGRDYMLAGLFDRAESLFLELVEQGLQDRRALRSLIEIYQAEKDWRRCLETAEQLRQRCDWPIQTEIAHYHCELADKCRRHGQRDEARAHLLDAQAVDPNCIRATLIQARMEMEGGDSASALMLYRHLARRGPDYLPAMLPELLHCCERLGRQGVARELGELFAAHPSSPLMLELSRAIEREQGPQAALRFLDDYLGHYADLVGAERLLELRLSGVPQQAAEGDQQLLEVIRHLVDAQPSYRCDQCGFEARALHWQCPSCKHWGSIKAVAPPLLCQPAGATAIDSGANRL